MEYIQNENKKYTDEELMHVYMGKTVNTLKGKFNIKLALMNTFLQSIWYLYNKAYICFILTELISLLVPFPIIFFVNGFLSEDFYKKEIKAKIEQIRKKNSYLSEEELYELIGRKGKKHKVLVIVYVIIYILIVLVNLSVKVIVAMIAEMLTLTDAPTFLDEFFK